VASILGLQVDRRLKYRGIEGNLMSTVEALAMNDEASAIMTETHRDRENERKLYKIKESRELASRMPVISRL